MNKTTEALKLAENQLQIVEWNPFVEEALAAIREALAEPVKQEPVAYIRKDQLQRAMKYPCLCEVSPEPRSDRVEIYAEPLDAKAIRAEALEEAAKVCEEYEGTLHQWTDKGKTFAAAIRGLK